MRDAVTIPVEPRPDLLVEDDQLVELLARLLADQAVRKLTEKKPTRQNVGGNQKKSPSTAWG